MQWEELTGDRFVEAVEECEGVCLLPLSVIERHGHHLPLGTDMYIGHEICRRAAAMESAVVFPNYVFTQIPEARHLAGTIAIDPDLMLKLLNNVCREIARNGLKKIVLVNAHGGNHGLISIFNMMQLYQPRDYTVYLVQPHSLLFGGKMEAPWDPATEGHAGPGETSLIMAVRPELVHMEHVPTDGEGDARDRLKELREAGIQTGIWWYADFPTHYQGDAAPATAETGHRFFDAMAEVLARQIKLIKGDSVTKELQDEFYGQHDKPGM